MAETPKVYRSARGSTVRLLGHGPANFTIDYRSREEGISGWRHLRFRDDPPRIMVWCDGEPEPHTIPLEEVLD